MLIARGCLILVAGVFTASCSGEPTPTPSSSLPRIVAGRWTGVITGSRIQATECGTLFDLAEPQAPFALEIQQSGTALTAISQRKDEACRYNGDVVSEGVKLTAVSCTPDTHKATCDGVDRDIRLHEFALSGALYLNELSVISYQIWNVYPIVTTSPTGTIVVTNSIELRR